MPEIQTAEQASQEMMRVAHTLESAVVELRAAGEARADAQVDWELANARAIKSSNAKSADLRKAEAALETEQQRRNYLRADVIEDYNKRRISSAQSVLSALMTATSALRQEMKLAGVG